MQKNLDSVPSILINGDDEYHVGRFLGNGAYSDCYEILQNYNRLAAKIIPSKKIKKRSSTEREIRIHKELRHPNIISLYTSFEYKGNIIMIMELGPSKTLDIIIKTEYILSEKIIRKYLIEILEGIKYIHSKSIIHRDVKPGNILVGDVIKLCDFGMAIQPGDKLNICGTPNYISPEVLNEQEQTSAIDMWSLGATIFIMTFGKAPFETKTVKQTYARITAGLFTFPKHIIISACLKDLIENLLIVNPYDRLTATEALEHEFFVNN